MMRTRILGILSAAVVMTTSGVAVLAQGEAGQAPQPPPGGGRFGGGMMRRGGGPVTLASVPVPTLEYMLKLKPDQVSKITPIHDQYQKDIQGLFPRPQPGTPPDPNEMRANMEKMRTVTQQANKDIEAVLTDDQKAKVKDTIAELGRFNLVTIPLAAVPDLKLTDDQRKQINDIAKDAEEKMKALAPEDRRTGSRTILQEARGKVTALLTEDQKSVVEKYRREMRGGGRRQATNA